MADLQNPPGNKLESLKGEYSIRIDRQWRICFIWKKENASNVEIVDYHS
ncbi:MAG: type II toxin-antitoxin system RelE/ParE family toxin [Pleurocapsa minor HA4230-MV1]|nr:type II toxin-antitoxin system RelE/ParE family toxin [Pleurocapsa minor HA4230-MV1]